LSGVELFGLVLFGVEVEDGLLVFGFAEFMSVLPELELGEVVLLELDGEVEFMSELLELGVVVSDGEVVDEGELEVLDPVWLDEVEGLLCAALPAAPPLLCAIARPVEKMTAVATVRSFLLICVFSLCADKRRWAVGWQGMRQVCQTPRAALDFECCRLGSDIHRAPGGAAVDVHKLANVFVDAARDDHPRNEIEAVTIRTILDNTVGQNFGEPGDEQRLSRTLVQVEYRGACGGVVPRTTQFPGQPQSHHDPGRPQGKSLHEFSSKCFAIMPTAIGCRARRPGG
jgi:hypothetical protein